MTHDPEHVGLCTRCMHARTVTTPRSTFWRCMLSDTDPRFDRYPRLPVIACPGFTPRDATAPAPEPDAE